MRLLSVSAAAVENANNFEFSEQFGIPEHKIMSIYLKWHDEPKCLPMLHNNYYVKWH